jgi:AmmeMemoRadiSam system protein A
VFAPEEDALLLDLAEASIREGFDGFGPLTVDLDGVPPALRRPCRAFVTVLVDGELNGCIGTLTADQPIAAAVARLAWESAYDDPRLPRLRPNEWSRTTIKISLLGAPTPMAATSEEDVLAVLRPGIDGLTIEAGWRRATFLPSVWETLPDPRQFLDHLEAKAGWRPRTWPAGARASRYVAREITRTHQPAA